MTETTVQKPGFYGWKNVALLFVIYMSALGLTFYGFSVIFPMMIKTLQWNRGTASIAHTISALLMGLLVPLVAISINKLGPKKTIIAGLIPLFIGLVLLGTVTSKMWQWIILWGFVVSFGFAFCGILPIQTSLMYWFNVKRGTAIGIVMTGAAVGGFLAQPFYTWLMRVTNTWQAGWLTGAFFALIAIVCAFLLVGKPEDVGQHPDGLNPDEAGSARDGTQSKPRTYRTEESWELKAALKTPTVWAFTVVIIGHLMPLFLVTSHGILHFTDKGFTGMQAASILSFIILGSGMARFPVGWLGDRIEPRWIITITLGVMVFMFIGIWKLTSLKLMIVSGMIFGICYGSQLIMFPTLLGNYFGPETFVAINGVIAPLLVGFGASVPVGAGYIFEKAGSYSPAFTILSFLMVIAFIVSFFLYPPKKRSS